MVRILAASLLISLGLTAVAYGRGKCIISCPPVPNCSCDCTIFEDGTCGCVCA